MENSKIMENYLQQLTQNNDQLKKTIKDFDLIIKSAHVNRIRMQKEIAKNDKEIDDLINAARNNGYFTGYVNDILMVVCEHFKVHEANVRKNKPNGIEVKEAKKAWIYLCYQLLNQNKVVDMSLQDIAFYAGLKNHATVLSAKNKVVFEITKYHEVKENIDTLLIKCENIFNKDVL